MERTRASSEPDKVMEMERDYGEIQPGAELVRCSRIFYQRWSVEQKDIFAVLFR